MVPLLIVLALVALLVGLATAAKWLVIVAVVIVAVAVVRGLMAGSRTDL